MLLNSFVLLDTRLAQGIAIWVGGGLVAFLIGKFVPQRRYAIRQVVVPALLVTALELIVGGLPDSLLGATLRGAMVHAAWLLTGLLTINGVGLLIFDLLLPRFIPVSRIAHELSVGLGYLVLILFFLRRFGVDFSSLLATSAVVTAIVAISMQATLGNAFGGLTLQLDRSLDQVLAQRQEEMARFKEYLDSGERLSRAERHRQIFDKMQAFFGLSSSDD